MLGVPDALLVAVVVAFALLSAVLTAAETALMRTTRSAAAELVEAGRRNATTVQQLVTDPGPATLASRQLRVLADTVAAASFTLVCASVIGSWWLALITAVLISSVVSIYVLGAGPRRFARQFPAGVMITLAPFLAGLARILAPTRRAAQGVGKPLETLRPELAFSEDQLRDMVDRVSELQAIEDTERAMIHSVFELGDTLTREVMVPRTDMITVEQDLALRKTMTLFLRSGFSRIPVVRGSVDDVVGIAYLKDVVRRLQAEPTDSDISVSRVMRPAAFVPESKPVDDLLRMMQHEATHVAIVVDEYGGTAGLVTIEDALEEIVGELTDEHDRAEREIEVLADGEVRVPARLALDELGAVFGIKLEDDEVDTVGGLLAKALGKVPLTGESAAVHGLFLEAERTEGRRKQLATVLVRVVIAPEDQLGEPAAGEKQPDELAAQPPESQEQQ